MRLWLIALVGVVGCSSATVDTGDAGSAPGEGGTVFDGGGNPIFDSGLRADVVTPAPDASTCNEPPTNLPGGNDCFPYDNCPGCGTTRYLCALGSAPGFGGCTNDNGAAPTGYTSSCCPTSACSRFSSFDNGQGAPSCGSSKPTAYACPLSAPAPGGCTLNGRGEGYSIGDNIYCCP